MSDVDIIHVCMYNDCIIEAYDIKVSEIEFRALTSGGERAVVFFAFSEGEGIMKNISERKCRVFRVVQVTFWVTLILLAILWFSHVVRATNDMFVPTIGFLIIFVLGVIAISRAVDEEDMSLAFLGTYGVICLILLFLIIVLVINTLDNAPLSLLHIGEAIVELLKNPSLSLLYTIIVASWIFPILHAITLFSGIASIYFAVKKKVYSKYS